MLRSTPYALVRLSLFASLAMIPTFALGDEWPQFRGPTGQGLAVDQNPPIHFSDTENVAWKTTTFGRGWSSPVVGNGKIWITTAVDEGKSLRAVAYDLETGKLAIEVEVFSIDAPVPRNAKNSHASPTPILDGDRLYAHFGAMGTACINTTTGEVLWRNQNLVIDHKEGPGSSCALAGDVLIVPCDGMDVQFVAGLNKHTGEVLWKTTRGAFTTDVADMHKAYSTPLVIPYQAKGATRWLAIVPGADQVSAFDTKNGKSLWTARYAGFSTVPRPVLFEDLVIVCTGYMKPQLMAIRPRNIGSSLEEEDIAWRYAKQAPANPSPIIVGGRVFMVSDSGVACCVNAKTGEEIWTKRLGGSYSASPVAAEDRLYFCSESGEVHVLRAADTFEQIAKNQLDGALMASPAVVYNALIFRTENSLYRIETSNE